MAGIGFDLRRLVGEDSGLLARLRGYAAAGLIAAGPWVVTMLSLWLVRAVATWLPVGEVERFLSIVSNVFALSLCTVGGMQMAVTRYLADALYVGDYRSLVPAFATSMALVAAVQASSGAFAGWLVGLDPALLLAATLLYTAVSLSWLAMVWLGLIRQHDKVLLAFVAGAVAFVAALPLLGPSAGVTEVVALYALANGLITALMAVVVVRGLERGERRSGAVLVGAARYWLLGLVGAAYGVSLWIDKWVFWWAEGSATVGALRHHPLYDSCFYLAYLTAIPALAVNLVHLETDFYTRYRAYYGAVTGNRPLREVRARGAEMAATLRVAAGRLLRVQGAVTVACMVFAAPITALAGLPGYAERVFRLACIGAFCHVLMLLSVLVLLYFDRRRGALRVCCAFLVANCGAALASLQLGPWSYGAGFSLAALLGLLVAVGELRWTFRRLEYLTFVR